MDNAGFRRVGNIPKHPGWKGPFDEDWMRQSKRNVEKKGLGGTVNGLYAFDFSGAQKVIVPVRLRSTNDNTAIIMTHKGLKLKLTIPMAGGVVDFDQHSVKIECEPFQPTELRN